MLLKTAPLTFPFSPKDAPKRKVAPIKRIASKLFSYLFKAINLFHFYLNLPSRGLRKRQQQTICSLFGENNEKQIIREVQLAHDPAIYLQKKEN